MPRHRHTFALILISFTILATVITAFRVRDLPKSDLKPSVRRQKCENCDDVSDLNLDQKLSSYKIDSSRRAYEDLKKAVREKQKQIKQKSSEFKFEFSHEDDDDDDDDDDDEDKSDIKVDKVKTISKESSNVLKTGFKTNSKLVATSKSLDDDDDDDDDDVDDVTYKKDIKVIKKTNIVEKTSSKENRLLKHKIDDDDADDDDDVDDDDDDDDDDVKHKTYSKAVKNKITDTKTSSKQKHTTDDTDDDDGSDDDDKDANLKRKVDSTKVNKIDIADKTPLKKKITIKHKTDDEDDDDEDDDDEDESDDDEKADDVKKSKSLNSGKISDKEKLNKKITLPVEKTVEKIKGVHKNKNTDKDDVDDENGDGKLNLPDEKKSEKTESKPKAQTTETTKSSHQQNNEKPVKDFDKKDQVVTTKAKVKSVESKEQINMIEKKSEIKPVSKKEDEKKVSSEKSKSKPNVDVIEKKHKADSTDHKPKKDEKKDSSTPKPVKPSIIDSDKKSKPSSDIKNKDDYSKEHLSSEKRDKHGKASTESFDTEEILQRQEVYLKQVTEALHRRNLLQSEFEDFYAFFPTFAPNFSRIHNPECRRHGQILLRQLRGTKLWALNMLDSTAKIPSGILQGNGIQLGDFDQCLGSHARVQLDTGSIVRVQGKYCLAKIDIKAEHPELEVPVHLAQAKNLFRSRIDDPGHFVPRFSTLSWGVCVPAACNPEDVEVVIRDTVKHYQHTSGIIIKVKVDEDDCHVEDSDWLEKWLETPTILTLSLYTIVILLVLIATLMDFMTSNASGEESSGPGEDEGEQKEDGEEKEEKVVEKAKSSGFLSAFSLYHTLSKLTASGSSDDIACIHGVRGVATIALLVAHKILPVAVTPYTNRVKVTESASAALWSWARAGWVFTDCFLLLSGALTAYRITVDSETSALKRIISRYLRLTPALLAVVLFYAFVWDHTSSGPMWGTFVTKNAEVCQDGWWWNLLYVQNYFGFEEMCAPQTHQLALDMQLTLLGGVVVWLLQVRPGASKIGLLLIHGLTAYSRYTTVRDHRLTLIAYHGVSVSQLYRTARLSYSSTLHRSTAYLIGLTLGLALQKPAKLGKIVLTLGWLLSIALSGLVWWAGYDSGYTTYHYSSTFAAQYAALAPIASNMAIAWMIYAVHSSGDGFLWRILCCPPLVFISRLSYAIYLCQFIIYLTDAATVRTSSEFTLIGLLDFQEISNILLTSTLLTVTFIIPMQSIKKFKITLFSKTEENDDSSGKTQEENSEEKPTDNENKSENEDIDGVVEMPSIRRSHLIVHREVLEEIPEVEIEYEMQREQNEGLEEIIEEEEDEEATDRDLENPLDEEEDIQIIDDDMEVIEEEVEGGEDFWTERDEIRPRRSFRFDDEDDEPDEYDYSANGRYRNGAQQNRYSR